MNKTKVMVGILVAVMLLTLVGCKAETVTTTITTAKTVTSSAPATTVTFTETKTVTAQPSTTSTNTTKTTTTSSSVTTSTNAILSPDGKLQLINLSFVGGPDGSLKGTVQNLSNETLNAEITVKLLIGSVLMGTKSTEVDNIAPGAQSAFTVIYHLTAVITSYTVSVEVIQ
jgi:hypothetical protein